MPFQYHSSGRMVLKPTKTQTSTNNLPRGDLNHQLSGIALHTLLLRTKTPGSPTGVYTCCARLPESHLSRLSRLRFCFTHFQFRPLHSRTGTAVYLCTLTWESTYKARLGAKATVNGFFRFRPICRARGTTRSSPDLRRQLLGC